MGNQNRANNREIQFESEHPHLSQCKIVTSEQRTLLKYTTCLDRKEYIKWKEALELYNEQSKLFLPIEHHFSTTTLCGNAGTIEVHFTQHRQFFHTILIFCIPKSTADSITKLISMNKNFGIFFLPSLQPKNKQWIQDKCQETSDRKMSC